MRHHVNDLLYNGAGLDVQGRTFVVRPPALVFDDTIGRPTHHMTGEAESAGYGVSCTDLAAGTGGVIGKKAWFGFGNIVVALGVDIVGASNRDIETTIVSRTFDSLKKLQVSFTLGGRSVPATGEKWSADATWAYIGGVAGYVIFDGASGLFAVRETRKAALYDVNREGYPAAPRFRERLKLGLTHGSGPHGHRYGYAVLPDATPGAAASLAARLDRRSVVNRAACQACTVRDGSKVVTGIVFWAAAQTEGVWCSVPASFLLVRQEQRMQITICALSPKSDVPIEVIVAGKFAGLIASDPAVQVTFRDNALHVSLPPAESGEPRTILVERFNANSALVVLAPDAHQSIGNSLLSFPAGYEPHMEPIC